MKSFDSIRWSNQQTVALAKLLKRQGLEAGAMTVPTKKKAGVPFPQIPYVLVLTAEPVDVDKLRRALGVGQEIRRLPFLKVEPSRHPGVVKSSVA